jgi:hypothetical protein
MLYIVGTKVGPQCIAADANDSLAREPEYGNY